MKQINNYIQEKLKLNKSVVNKHQNIYTLFPKDRKELINMIKNEIRKNGQECSLNHIDVSKINDLSGLFEYKKFDGDISCWDVSNVKDMAAMFKYSKFTGKNGDISSWDVSNVNNMFAMFAHSNYNGNISEWNISKVKSMSAMFADSKFNNDISSWKLNTDCKTISMFRDCPIEEKYKPNLPKN